MSHTISQVADREWGWTAAVGCVVGVLAYVAAAALDLSGPALVTLSALFGFGITFGSLGLYHALARDAAPKVGAAGAVCNVVAGALVVAMLLVQLASRAPGSVSARLLQPVHLGLDVAWDLYIGVGTLAFAYVAWRHPALGRALGLLGALAATLLLVLNVATFPTPPAAADSVDVGPAVGLWYLAVGLRMAWALTRSRALAAVPHVAPTS
jgi:hypothetical protein